LTLYFDTSVLVSLLVRDSNGQAALDLAQREPDSQTSTWAVTEFSSALSLRVRKGLLDVEERAAAERAFDLWLADRPEMPSPTQDDFLNARSMLMRSAAPLRAPDALHLSLCARLELELATFDVRMRQAAAEFGIASAII